MRLRLEVLETLGEWITQGGGAQDALDDATLYEALLTFLTQPTERKLLESIFDQESDAGQALRALEVTRKTLLVSFRSQTMRPIPRSASAPEPVNDTLSAGNHTIELPDIDHLDPEELVNTLNSMASATFRNMTQEVCFTLSRIRFVRTDRWNARL